MGGRHWHIPPAEQFIGPWQCSQAAPFWPHSAFLSPGWQWSPLQQPLQLAALQPLVSTQP
jgi:hypothetical protein